MRIKNWSKFQHFKDRTPPWIKLHRNILEQRDINSLSDSSFRVLVCVWLLAAEDEEQKGTIPSVEDIAFRLRLPESKISKALQELSAFMEQDDIDLISGQYQSVPPETEAEAYKEEVEKLGEFKNVSLSKQEIERLITDMTEPVMKDYIERLSEYIPNKKPPAYRDHNAAIRSWWNKDKKEGKVGTPGKQQSRGEF